MMPKQTIIFLIISILLSCSRLFGQQGEYEIASIGFYNLENLFHPSDDPDIFDEEFTPNGSNNYTEEVYADKLGKLSSVISQLGKDKTPDGLAILGVCEIENRKVLEDLVKQPVIAKSNYQIVHYDSPDRRGIDTGLLYNPKYFSVDTSYTLFVNLSTKGDTSYTRDVLYVEGKLKGEPISLFVNHWPSRSGGEQRSAPRRKKAASVVRKKVEEILDSNPDHSIVVMGDMNDDPYNDSLSKILKAKENKKRLKKDELYNPMWGLHKKGGGTLAYRDAWSLFDSMVISRGLASQDEDGFFLYKAEIFNKLFLAQKTGLYKGYPSRSYSFGSYIGGYSDHFPVMLHLVRKKV